jgi:modification methylase
MAQLDDNSVDLVVTSPPYWQLKDYGSKNEIGFNNSYEEYINQLNQVWMEAYRVLDYGCRLCINIGDQYARSVFYGRYKVIPIRTEIIKFCETIGFDYMGAIIWQKIATTNTSGGATIMGSFPYPRNGILKMDYEFILLFKKVGTSKKSIDKDLKLQSKMTIEEWNQFFTGHWRFPGMKQKAHLAMFPPELPRRLIKMFTFVGDTVLDPFLGSGTTSLAAMELNRHSVGFEINPEFLSIIKKKCGVIEQGEQCVNPEKNRHLFSFISQEKLPKNFNKDFKNLPYIFKDPVKLAPKVDPKSKNHFESKIDKKRSFRETYFSIKKIISPTSMLLSDGTTIQLLGIKIEPTQIDNALQFIKEKLNNQRVFLKHDNNFPKPDSNGTPFPCYLYLRNRTFINAHLIKKRLAVVDISIDFKHKTRFLRYHDEAMLENNEG